MLVIQVSCHPIILQTQLLLWRKLWLNNLLHLLGLLWLRGWLNWLRFALRGCKLGLGWFLRSLRSK